MSWMPALDYSAKRISRSVKIFHHFFVQKCHNRNLPQGCDYFFINIFQYFLTDFLIAKNNQICYQIQLKIYGNTYG